MVLGAGSTATNNRASSARDTPREDEAMSEAVTTSAGVC
jgi:hypothetical protein